MRSKTVRGKYDTVLRVDRYFSDGHAGTITIAPPFAREYIELTPKQLRTFGEACITIANELEAHDD